MPVFIMHYCGALAGLSIAAMIGPIASAGCPVTVVSASKVVEACPQTHL